MDDLNVISQQQISDLKDAAKLIPALEGEMKRAKMAGIDVDEMVRELAEQKTLIAGMLRVYGK